MQQTAEIKESFRFLIMATLLTVALWFIPFAEVITYPIRIFVTFVHEAGHALAALATLGGVNRIELSWNGSGVTETVGGASMLISSAGYLASTLYGAGLLLVLRRARNARWAALGSGIGLLLITALFGGNYVAWLVGLAVGAGCVALALKARPRAVHFFMSFLAIQCLLNAFYDLRTLMYISVYNPELATDARNMSDATGGIIPPMLWAVGWTVISTAILIATLLVYYRSLRRRAAMVDPPAAALISDQSESAFRKHA
jgi:hypothetical protein